MDNVIVLTFRGTDRARASLGALRRIHDAGEIRLQAVAVVERTEDGRPVVIDQAEDVGSLVHIAEVGSSDAVLRTFTSAVPRGYAATVAVIDEPAPAPVDALAAEFGVAPLRRSRAEVEGEIAEAEEAAIARRR